MRRAHAVRQFSVGLCVRVRRSPCPPELRPIAGSTGVVLRTVAGASCAWVRLDAGVPAALGADDGSARQPCWLSREEGAVLVYAHECEHVSGTP
jgi:hypothetical protein